LANLTLVTAVPHAVARLACCAAGAKVYLPSAAASAGSVAACAQDRTVTGGTSGEDGRETSGQPRNSTR
jgi:hypothetical protein